MKSGSEAFRAELLNERRTRLFNSYMSKAKSARRWRSSPDVVTRVTSRAGSAGSSGRW